MMDTCHSPYLPHSETRRRARPDGVCWGMAHFFFHVRQQRTLFEDTRGGEFADLGAAWNWAISDVRSMIGEGQVEGPIEQHWVEIADVTGAVVASLPFARVQHPN